MILSVMEMKFSFEHFWWHQDQIIPGQNSDKYQKHFSVALCRFKFWPEMWRQTSFLLRLTLGHLSSNEKVSGPSLAVVGEKLLLRPPSLGGRLTDRKSEEQQADKAASATIDCRLTTKVHYPDRPEPQHHHHLHFLTPSLLPLNFWVGPVSLMSRSFTPSL